MVSYEFDDPLNNDLDSTESLNPDLSTPDSNSTFPTENSSLVNSSMNPNAFNNGLDMNEPSITNNGLLSGTGDCMQNQPSSLSNPAFGESNDFDCSPMNSNAGQSLGSFGTNITFGCYPDPDPDNDPIRSLGRIHHDSTSFGSNHAIDSAGQNHSVEGSGMSESTQQPNDNANGKGEVHFGASRWKHICHKCGHVWWCTTRDNVRCPDCNSWDNDYTEWE